MNIAQNWRLNAQRYKLTGNQNADGSVNFPPRPAVENREIERYHFDTDKDETGSESVIHFDRPVEDNRARSKAS